MRSASRRLSGAILALALAAPAWACGPYRLAFYEYTGLYYRGADGQYRWFLSRAVPVRDADGRVLRWLGTNTDITLQREAEQRKDDFLALLAHELRNPLAPISTAAQLLKMGGSNPEYVRRSSDIIDRQVKHMSDLVNDIMDVSRVTRGLVWIEKREVSLAQVVHSAVEQSRPLVEARRHALALHLAAEPAFVEGDHKRLQQVLANLLNNAAKYTPEGGRLNLAMTVTPEQVAIVVGDNGIGIDPAYADRLFEPFARLTTRRQFNGSGLGLAVCRQIVQMHHGSIGIRPGEGQGAVVDISLPFG